MKFNSICVKDDLLQDIFKPAHTPPIYATSTFIYESAEEASEVFAGKKEGYLYARMKNPNVELVERKLAILEAYGSGKEAKAVVFGSGMAAIAAAFQSVLKPGEVLLAQESVYGATSELIGTIIQDMGVKVVLDPLTDISKAESLIKMHKPRMLYVESPSNPTLHCVDLQLIAEVAKANGCLSVIDSTFAGPYLQQPLLHGFDLVIHSTTKYLNGHSTGLGGVVIGFDHELIDKKIRRYRKLTGATASAFDAWLLNNGLKTLSMRMDRHSSNAQILAEWLERHPAVAAVNYLGLPAHHSHAVAKKYMKAFSGVLSFDLKGGFAAGKKLMEQIRFICLTATLGTPDTLIQHPASMSHQSVSRDIRLKNGITDGLIRMSVGLENTEDILEDLEQALAGISN